VNRPYFSDPYTTRFDARVVGRRETTEGPAVLLEPTYFYPEGGGQPFDLGWIDGIAVRKVVEEEQVVLHLLERMPERENVSCVIDAARRRDHMQQHSGQHILSAAFVREAGAATVSFHLGSSTSTIDLDREVGAEELEKAEREANRIVGEARPIRSYFVEPGEARELELRKSPEREGTLRIVEVEGFDRQACCGTHPRSSAEVGPILVRGTERVRGASRVEFVCGARALSDYSRAIARLRALTRLLGAPEDEIAEAAEKLVAEKNGLAKAFEAARAELLASRVAGWAGEAERLGATRVLVRELPEVSPAELRLAAQLFTREPDRLALLATRAEGRAHLVFARSSNLTCDVAALLRVALPAVEGRGGGNPAIAQGGGAKEEGVGEALRLAREELRLP
jgi:alanyl-tRNA synthetase